MGFVRGDASACVFHHPQCEATTSAHGDDFTTCGSKLQLDWFKQQLEKKYEPTEQCRLGPGANDHKGRKILNRIIRWTDRGIEYEANPRQTETVVDELTLVGAKTVGTPGVKASAGATASDEDLELHQHTAFRGVAARCNYLAADRPDIQFSAKETCRWMAKPSKQGLAALKRFGRYLEGHQRLVLHYPQYAEVVDVYSDTDWAGCLRTRRSTSGGLLDAGEASDQVLELHPGRDSIEF